MPLDIHIGTLVSILDRSVGLWYLIREWAMIISGAPDARCSLLCLHPKAPLMTSKPKRPLALDPPSPSANFEHGFLHISSVRYLKYFRFLSLFLMHIMADFLFAVPRALFLIGLLCDFIFPLCNFQRARACAAIYGLCIIWFFQRQVDSIYLTWLR